MSNLQNRLKRVIAVSAVILLSVFTCSLPKTALAKPDLTDVITPDTVDATGSFRFEKGQLCGNSHTKTDSPTEKSELNSSLYSDNILYISLDDVTDSNEVIVDKDAIAGCEDGFDAVEFYQTNDSVKSLTIDEGAFSQTKLFESQADSNKSGQNAVTKLKRVSFKNILSSTRLKISKNAFAQFVKGQNGGNGLDGVDGSEGSRGNLVHNGGDGGNGTDGSAGKNGGSASTSLAEVTFPDRLTSLYIEDGAFSQTAIGGNGGNGGRGGDGGDGGDISGKGATSGGNGGNGGKGNAAGNGGDAKTSLTKITFPEIIDNPKSTGKNGWFYIGKNSFSQKTISGNGGDGGIGGCGGLGRTTGGTGSSKMNGGNGASGGYKGFAGSSNDSLSEVNFSVIETNVFVDDEAFSQDAYLGSEGNFGFAGFAGIRGCNVNGGFGATCGKSGQDGDDSVHINTNFDPVLENGDNNNALASFKFNFETIPGYAPDTVYFGKNISGVRKVDGDPYTVINWEWNGASGCSNTIYCLFPKIDVNQWGTNMSGDTDQGVYYLRGKQRVEQNTDLTPHKSENSFDFVLSNITQTDPGVYAWGANEVISKTKDICSPQTSTLSYDSKKHLIFVSINLYGEGNCELVYNNTISSTIPVYKVSYDRNIGQGKTPNSVYVVEGTELTIINLNSDSFMPSPATSFIGFQESATLKMLNQGDKWIVPKLDSGKFAVVLTAKYKLNKPEVSDLNFEQPDQIFLTATHKSKFAALHYTISEKNQIEEPTCSSPQLENSTEEQEVDLEDYDSSQDYVLSVIACPNNSAGPNLSKSDVVSVS